MCELGRNQASYRMGKKNLCLFHWKAVTLNTAPCSEDKCRAPGIFRFEKRDYCHEHIFWVNRTPATRAAKNNAPKV